MKLFQDVMHEKLILDFKKVEIKAELKQLEIYFTVSQLPCVMLANFRGHYNVQDMRHISFDRLKTEL